MRCMYQITHRNILYCKIYKGDITTVYMQPMQVSADECAACPLRNRKLDFVQLAESKGKTLVDLPAALEPPNSKQIERMPSLTKRVQSYTKAASGWVASGRPKRSDEEVERIFHTLCQPCKYFDGNKQACKLCGCRVAEGGSGWRNKIRMLTQNCPKGKW